MNYAVSTVKDDLNRSMHNAFDSVTGQNNVIEQAARDILAVIDPIETKQVAQVTNAIYSNVYRYAVPSDLKKDKIIDLRPQVNRGLSDSFTQYPSKEFGKYRSYRNNILNVTYDNGTKFMQVSKTVGEMLVLNTADSLTEGGSWAVGGDAENLTLDTENYVSGTGALNFDLDGSTTTGYVERTANATIDASEYEDIGSIFTWVFLPDADAITNLILRWGNDTSNYWSRTVTAPHFGSFEDGWNLVRFDWNGATKTGSPSASALDYLRFIITYDGTADTDFRLDNIVLRKGEIFEIEYYSKYLFRTSAGVWGETITADTDLVNLDTDAYNLLLYRAAYLAALNIQAEDGSFDVKKYEDLWNEAKSAYLANYKSEKIHRQSTYYEV